MALRGLVWGTDHEVVVLIPHGLDQPQQSLQAFLPPPLGNRHHPPQLRLGLEERLHSLADPEIEFRIGPGMFQGLHQGEGKHGVAEKSGIPDADSFHEFRPLVMAVQYPVTGRGQVARHGMGVSRIILPGQF